MVKQQSAGDAARRRLLTTILLQALPLIGLGGCTALWTALPVNLLVRQSGPLLFWGFIALIVVCLLASLSWGLGYLYLGARERLGCGLALLGPLFVIWCFGYAFGGFVFGIIDDGGIGRRHAIIATTALCSGPLLLLVIDAWRLARRDHDNEMAEL